MPKPPGYKKQSQPVIITRKERSHHRGDNRRKCVVCDLALADSNTEFINYQGNIGRAHKPCADQVSEVKEAT